MVNFASLVPTYVFLGYPSEDSFLFGHLPMAASVEQLKKALAELDRQVTELELQLQKVYQNYLAALQQAVQRQLVLASYHICTEGNPEGFLQLSVSDRQTLQERIRQLGKEGQQRLESALHPENDLPEPPIDVPNPSFPAQILPPQATPAQPPMPFTAQLASTAFLQSQHQDALDEDDGEDEDEADRSLQEHLDQEHLDQEHFSHGQPSHEQLSHERLSQLLGTQLNKSADPNVTGEVENELEALLAKVAAVMGSRQPNTPVDRLLNWQEGVERSLRQTLRQLSHRTNQSLQKANILDPKLPDQVLEVAAKAEGTEATSKVPNIVQMLVEATVPGKGRWKTKEPKAAVPKPPSALIHVMAVQLRLSDLEFHDPSLMTWRNQLRELGYQIQAIGQEYRKRQRQKAIAEAQVAWRSTWTQDND